MKEHEKLHTIRDKSQVIGEFLEWLNMQGIVLASYHEHDECCYPPDKFGSSRSKLCGLSENELYSFGMSIQKLLAIFFEIDPDKLEDEKRAILASLRSDEVHKKTQT